jgi:hypothetical protein
LGDLNDAIHKAIDVDKGFMTSPVGRRMEAEYWLLYSAVYPDSEGLYPDKYKAARA